MQVARKAVKARSRASIMFQSPRPLRKSALQLSDRRREGPVRSGVQSQAPAVTCKGSFPRRHFMVLRCHGVSIHLGCVVGGRCATWGRTTVSTARGAEITRPHVTYKRVAAPEPAQAVGCFVPPAPAGRWACKRHGDGQARAVGRIRFNPLGPCGVGITASDEAQGHFRIEPRFNPLICRHARPTPTRHGVAVIGSQVQIPSAPAGGMQGIARLSRCRDARWFRPLRPLPGARTGSLPGRGVDDVSQGGVGNPTPPFEMRYVKLHCAKTSATRGFSTCGNLRMNTAFSAGPRSTTFRLPWSLARWRPLAKPRIAPGDRRRWTIGPGRGHVQDVGGCQSARRRAPGAGWPARELQVKAPLGPGQREAAQRRKGPTPEAAPTPTLRADAGRSGGLHRLGEPQHRQRSPAIAGLPTGRLGGVDLQARRPNQGIQQTQQRRRGRGSVNTSRRHSAPRRGDAGVGAHGLVQGNRCGCPAACPTTGRPLGQTASWRLGPERARRVGRPRCVARSMRPCRASPSRAC